MSASSTVVDTLHGDTIHDVQFDYYGKRFATCSSDRTIKIFSAENDQTLLAELHGHNGPVWQIAWAHPRFGNIMASCSYDRSVILWQETSPNNWTILHQHNFHNSSVNSIAFAPHEAGLLLACASSDGQVSIVARKQEGSEFITSSFVDNSLGLNSVTWAPINHIGAAQSGGLTLRLATAGCDHKVKVYALPPGTKEWKQESSLSSTSHDDWVRDVAWAPASGLPVNMLASACENGSVLLWKQKAAGDRWDHSTVATFDSPVWRVSWSLTGSILAISCGDNNVTLWKESIAGEWKRVGDIANEPFGKTVEN